VIEIDILVADAVRALRTVGKTRDAQIIFGGGTPLSQALWWFLSGKGGGQRAKSMFTGGCRTGI